MRSLTELQDIASARGIDPTGLSREELMDLLRGEADSMQVDPMKAKDLKAEILWGTPNPFVHIAKYLTPGYALEPKLDGARMRLFITPEGVRLNTGRRSTVTYAYIDRTDNFPHLQAPDLQEALAGTILDGEIMAPSAKIPTKGGSWTNSHLNAAVALTNVDPAWSVGIQEAHGKATFWAFDIMALQGNDLTGLPYEDRRKLLTELVAQLDNEHVKTTPVMEATAENIHLSLAQGFEGAMLKLKTGKYEAGKRSKNWLKVKTMSTADAFITGFEPGKGRNEGKVGAVKFSLKDDLGLDKEVGQFGAINDQLRDEITADPNSFLNRVVEFMGQGVTKDDRIRHPQLVRFRPDKTPEDCTLDQLDPFPRC